jgi:enoyl-CoA hydratase/carnithine racemase
MSQESDHERIRRLIQERMERGKRPVGIPPINLAAVQGGLGLLAFALFRQAFVEAMVEQRERDAGIVPGDPNAPALWDGLEALLGKETVDRMRAGT